MPVYIERNKALGLLTQKKYCGANEAYMKHTESDNCRQQVCSIFPGDKWKIFGQVDCFGTCSNDRSDNFAIYTHGVAACMTISAAALDRQFSHPKKDPGGGA